MALLSLFGLRYFLRRTTAGAVILAATESGGQGKMVALGRALMLGTRLLILDEPLQGLAPVLAQNYAEALRKLREQDRDPTLLVTESIPSCSKHLRTRYW